MGLAHWAYKQVRQYLLCCSTAIIQRGTGRAIRMRAASIKPLCCTLALPSASAAQRMLRGAQNPPLSRIHLYSFGRPSASFAMLLGLIWLKCCLIQAAIAAALFSS